MISTTPTQKCLDTWVERQNFTAVREVLCNSGSCNPMQLGDRPKKFVFVRQTTCHWEANAGWAQD